MIQYKLYEDFLSESDNSTLLDMALTEDNWKDSEVVSGVSTWRQSKVKHIMKDSIPFLMNKIESKFDILHQEFYRKKSIYDQCEIQLTRSHDGDFYKPHQDIGDDYPYKNRKITFVYYFNTTPKRFSDGKIKIYEHEKNPILGAMYKRSKFVEITPVNNTLLMFPSHLWHEVLPVKCDLDWTYSRFTINGWLH